MPRQRFWPRTARYGFLLFLILSGAGCHFARDLQTQTDCCKPPDFNCCTIADAPVPKELNKVSLPPYVIETPDILQIDAVRVIPLPPYRLDPLDIVYLTAQNVYEQFPIDGRYPIDPDGTINLGPRYGGTVRIIDLTTEEAQRAVQTQLREKAKDAVVTLSLGAVSRCPADFRAAHRSQRRHCEPG